MENFCKNHTDRPTQKRCYHCHQYICSKCQRIASHHLFCSKKCHLQFLVSSTLAGFKNRLLVIWRKTKKAPANFLNRRGRLVLDLVLLSLIVSSLLLLRSVVRELKELKKNPPVVLNLQSRRPETQSTSVAESTLSIKGQPQAMVLRNSIDVNGEADDNVIISLSVNERLTDVTLAKNGRFHFKDVPLRRGSNNIVIRAIGRDGATMMLEELNTFYGSPTLNYLSRSLDRGNADRTRMALTFDGGAEDNAANEILDYLAEKQLKCTMFLTGSFIRRHRELVRRMVAEGHEVGNHTWSHPHLTSYELNRRHNTLPEINREVVQSELLQTAELFKQVTGQDMAPLWRAPFGEHNLQIRQWAAEIGFRHVGWTIGYGNGESMDTMDWVADTAAANYHSSKEILARILNFGNSNHLKANGSIALMHLGSNRATDPAHKILPALIDSLRSRGYELVTASELIQ